MFAALGHGLFTGSGLVSVLFSLVYFGVRRAHKGRLSSDPGCDNAVVCFAAALDRWICFLAVFGRMMLFVVPQYSKGRRSKKRRLDGRGRLVMSLGCRRHAVRLIALVLVPPEYRDGGTHKFRL